MVVERLLARLTSWFAVLALLLAGIGLYGVVNDSVIQRRREIGVRMALGARAPDIVRHVTAGALVLVAVGLALGLGGGVAFGRVIGSLLPGHADGILGAGGAVRDPGGRVHAGVVVAIDSRSSHEPDRDAAKRIASTCNRVSSGCRVRMRRTVRRPRTHDYRVVANEVPSPMLDRGGACRRVLPRRIARKRTAQGLPSW